MCGQKNKAVWGEGEGGMDYGFNAPLYLVMNLDLDAFR